MAQEQYSRRLGEVEALALARQQGTEKGLRAEMQQAMVRQKQNYEEELAALASR